MEGLRHLLNNYRGAPGQGAIVKQALEVFYTELAALKAAATVAVPVASCGCDCGARLDAIEAELAPDECPPVLTTEAAAPKEECPPIVALAAVAPIVAAAVPIVAAVVSSKGAEPEATPIGSYTLGVSQGNEPLAPAPEETNEGNLAAADLTDDELEAILAEDANHEADRFESIAAKKMKTATKVRALAAGRRRAKP